MDAGASSAEWPQAPVLGRGRLRGHGCHACGGAVHADERIAPAEITPAADLS